MTEQQTIEKNFKTMLDNNPDFICLEAINSILHNFKENNVDCTKMIQWVDKKLKTAKNIPLPEYTQ